MIRVLVKNLESAVKLAWSKSQLVYIVILLIVPPLTFTFLITSLNQSARDQAEAGLKQVLVTNQITLATLVSSGLDEEKIQNLIISQIEEIDDLKNVIIAKEVGQELIITHGNKPELIGNPIKDKGLYQSSIAHNGDTVIYPFERNGGRVWLAYRFFETNDSNWYVHTEFNLAKFDEIINKQTSSILPALLVSLGLLLALIWWLWRQTDYKNLWHKAEAKLTEQFNFNNMMVHELRAPLTAINGYISMLGEGEGLNDSQKEYVKRTSLSTERLLRLVNDFLEVARIQSGTLKVSLQSQNISTIINNVVGELIVSANAKKLSLRAEVPTSPVMLMTDRARLQQVVTNLVSNAIKYTDTGEIIISIIKKPRVVEVRIKDTGHGISSADQAKLFKPFSRVGNADSGAEVGSGLGLWITKQLTEKLGGQISIESIEGVGTHVILSLDIPKD